MFLRLRRRNIPINLTRLENAVKEYTIRSYTLRLYKQNDCRDETRGLSHVPVENSTSNFAESGQ